MLRSWSIKSVFKNIFPRRNVAEEKFTIKKWSFFNYYAKLFALYTTVHKHLTLGEDMPTIEGINRMLRLKEQTEEILSRHSNPPAKNDRSIVIKMRDDDKPSNESR
jgi:hypothetical protein